MIVCISQEFGVNNHDSLASVFSFLYPTHFYIITICTNFHATVGFFFSLGYLPLHHKQYKTKIIYIFSCTFQYHSVPFLDFLQLYWICLFCYYWVTVLYISVHHVCKIPYEFFSSCILFLPLLGPHFHPCVYSPVHCTFVHLLHI